MFKFVVRASCPRLILREQDAPLFCFPSFPPGGETPPLLRTPNSELRTPSLLFLSPLLVLMVKIKSAREYGAKAGACCVFFCGSTIVSKELIEW